MVISRRPCEEAEVVCNKAEVPCVGDGQKTLDCIGTRCGGREDDSSTRRADILSHTATRTEWYTTNYSWNL
ncbi:hypothetical protein K443DRAFT_676534 [Laccaria amethystina LaAM-08-1]|uniref:Uncharacterized protein n=1 Tax=Laccaria amethystina LaAM-08-1 TaxID=1095629 RepID=A0A0C9XQ17_9AGAR|nr:hypothetical protein K443DRAFT_676534 [Laccaria amethystina LaAM-08-1]